VVAASSCAILDLESPASTQPVEQRRQRRNPCPTLDGGLGSELHRFQHAIKLCEPWIPIVRWSIGSSAAYPTLFHAAMVSRDRGRPVHGPLGGAVRPRRVVRFARLMYRRVRAFGRTYVRAACGGNLSRTCLPRTMVSEDQSIPIC
jgi:hypothetical protein